MYDVLHRLDVAHLLAVDRADRHSLDGPRAALDPAVRRRLEDAYSDEIELAGKLIGRDLAALWKPTA